MLALQICACWHRPSAGMVEFDELFFAVSNTEVLMNPIDATACLFTGGVQYGKNRIGIHTDC